MYMDVTENLPLFMTERNSETWRVVTVRENYRKSNTIAMFSLTPFENPRARHSDQFLNYMNKKGVSRFYNFFLFNRVGDLVSNYYSRNKLYSDDCFEALKRLLPKVSRVVWFYNETDDFVVNQMINRRYKELSNFIKKEFPELKQSRRF